MESNFSKLNVIANVFVPNVHAAEFVPNFAPKTQPSQEQQNNSTQQSQEEPLVENADSKTEGKWCFCMSFY